MIAVLLFYGCATVKPKPEPKPKPQPQETEDPCDPENTKKDPIQEILCG